jgi:hypothetical protein
MTHDNYKNLDGSPGVLSPQIEGVLINASKPGMVNMYAPAFSKWRAFAEQRHWQVLPARSI